MRHLLFAIRWTVYVNFNDTFALILLNYKHSRYECLPHFLWLLCVGHRLMCAKWRSSTQTKTKSPLSSATGFGDVRKGNLWSCVCSWISKRRTFPLFVYIYIYQRVQCSRATRLSRFCFVPLRHFYNITKRQRPRSFRECRVWTDSWRGIHLIA